MPDYKALEKEFQRILGLIRRPVAVSLRDDAPRGVEKFSGSEPSGCSFWRLAAHGRTFATVPSDHYNCPIGAHTHNIPLPENRSHELPQILETMTGLGYVKMEEVPGIPVLQHTPKNIMFAPLGETPVDPDVVLFAAKPGKLMLLEEAANRAGIRSSMQLLTRPTCMAIPAALTEGMVTSAGCIGNRVYTDLTEDELYSAVPGSAIERLAGELATIVAANNALADYHRARRRELSTA